MKRFYRPFAVLTVAVAALVFIAAPGRTMAGDGGIGFSASLQSQQMAVGVPIWLGDALVLDPSLGFQMVSEGPTDLNIGIGLRIFPTAPDKSDAAFFYIEPMLEMFMLTPNEGDGVTDLAAGAGFGGEYFFNDRQFSISVEGQLKALLPDEASNRFSSGGETVIRTSAEITASVYLD